MEPWPSAHAIQRLAFGANWVVEDPIMIEVIDFLNPACGHQRVERRLLGGLFQ
jgi:hypothetical protein